MSDTIEDRIQSEIQHRGPREACRFLLAENDAKTRGPILTSGRALAAERTAIHTALVADWAAEMHQRFGYDRPFAVAALGGTGRGEMAPHSDTDFAFLFDDVLDPNPFLSELQRHVLHSTEFRQRCGFVCGALPFNLDDMPKLDGKQLNAFIDFRPVYDPDNLAGRFVDRIRDTFDPFEHFLHVSSQWRDLRGKSVADAESLDRFNIKNEGLRVFLAGVWMLGGKEFAHSHTIYETLDDPRDLAAYEFLLRIRAFIHLRRPGATQPAPGGNHPEDVLGFDDFNSFGEMLGADADDRMRFEFTSEVLEKLLSARRRVDRFAKGVIGRELRDGRRVSASSTIAYGVGGLHQTVDPSDDPTARSRAALALLVASQHYGVDIDPAELESAFRAAGDWLEPVPEVSSLFYERRGSLADSFKFLAQLDGAEERLFPGHAKFEASVDDRVIAEQKTMRGALVRKKIQELERLVREGRELVARAVSAAQLSAPDQAVSEPVEAAMLDVDQLAAVKLALKTKRLPLTEDDAAVRADESLKLHERFASGFSGIPLDDYYFSALKNCDFSAETLRVARFLVANRRAFKERTRDSLNDSRQVQEFASLCQDAQLLRALFVFTCADRADWDSATVNPARWFNTRELYSKVRLQFMPGVDPAKALLSSGYSPDELAILRDFGEDFFSGIYRQYANRFGSQLVRMAESGSSLTSKARVLRDGTSTMIGIAARDFRGLAASITGAFWRLGVGLQQAHLFSALNHGLAMDFFHLAPNCQKSGPEIVQGVEEAIAGQLYVKQEDESQLPPLLGSISLGEWRPGLYCLRCETGADVGAVLYTLTYKIFRHLRGNIFGLTAHAGRGCTYVSIYHSLPGDLPLSAAQALIAERF